MNPDAILRIAMEVAQSDYCDLDRLRDQVGADSVADVVTKALSLYIRINKSLNLGYDTMPIRLDDVYINDADRVRWTIAREVPQ